MLLLAKVPAVIAPEYDDHVIPVRGCVEALHQSADHRVAKRAGRQVSLNRFLPASGFQHFRVIAFGLGHLPASRRDVIEVGFEYFRKHNLVERE